MLNGQLFIVEAVSDGKKGAITMEVTPEDDRQSAATKIRCLPGFFDHSEIPYSVKKDYDDFTYGYALTVHKSQGSQWNNVYLFDESSSFKDDRRKHLYTALTRAAEKITVAI
jgi:exodeoxyribonuclease-5